MQENESRRFSLFLKTTALIFECIHMWALTHSEEYHRGVGSIFFKHSPDFLSQNERVVLDGLSPVGRRQTNRGGGRGGRVILWSTVKIHINEGSGHCQRHLAPWCRLKLEMQKVDRRLRRVSYPLSTERTLVQQHHTDPPMHSWTLHLFPKLWVRVFPSEASMWIWNMVS